MNRRISPAVALVSYVVGASVLFGLLSHRVKRHETAHFDGAVRKRFPKRRRRATKKAATTIGPIGKEWIHAPIAALAAAYLWSQGRRSGAATVLASSLAGAGISRLFEVAMPPRRPPPGRHSPTEPSYPSGHSLETMAVGMTTAYVLMREDLADARIAMPMGIAIPLISGIGRLYLDRHWATDVLAGWLAGTTVAAGAAAVYEATAD